MTIREGDTLPYLRFKQTLIRSGSDAVFADGTKRRVFIVNEDEDKDLAQQRLFVELDNYTFQDPRSLPGFESFQLTPEETAWQEAEAAKAAEPAKPKNFQELQQQAQQKARNTMADRYQQNKGTAVEHSNVNRTVQMFADAAKREREAVAARMRPAR